MIDEESKRIRVVEFYNTGICESEPRSIVKVTDREGLHHALDNELFNLDESERIEVRVYYMTEKEWDESVRLGEEMV